MYGCMKLRFVYCSFHWRQSHGAWCQACFACGFATGVEAWTVTLFLVFEVSGLIFGFAFAL